MTKTKFQDQSARAASVQALREEYFSACRDNDVERVRDLLEQGAEVNWRTEDDMSGLHYAARYNYGELVEVLLGQKGVNVNITKNKNWTPLMAACCAGHENIVRRLCRAPNINLNIRAENGVTPLHAALLRNKPRCVEVFRDVAAVDWNVRTNSGDYPLTWAVESGYPEILRTILSVPEPQLDVSVTDPEGRTVGQIAVEKSWGDRQRCLEILCQDQRISWDVRAPATGQTLSETRILSFSLKCLSIQMSLFVSVKCLY